MAGGLRKVADNVYAASGTLDGISGPGRRTVKWLELRKLSPGEDLSVLGAFADLTTLELERIDDLDLSPLRGLMVKRLVIKDASRVDLGPLAQLPQLEFRILSGIDEVSVPSLRFGESLKKLVITNDDPALTGAPVKQIVEAIDWECLADLTSLGIHVGGLYVMRPIELDLSFLRLLPALERLDLDEGVRHNGARPSPIEPPFAGLSKKLTTICVSAWEPEPRRLALCAYLGRDPKEVETGVVVCQRHPFEEPAPPWSITGPLDGSWLTYGSLLRTENGAHDDTEHDACRRTKRRLGKADAALLRRLDFDPENSGTGISARSAEDLASALRILGLAE